MSIYQSPKWKVECYSIKQSTGNGWLFNTMGPFDDKSTASEAATAWWIQHTQGPQDPEYGYRLLVQEIIPQEELGGNDDD